MSNISQQFLFALGATATTATSVSIPTGSVAPGGGTTFYSREEKGDGYFGFSDGIHTVTYTVSPSFTGSIIMQASLATSPTTTDWFDITGTNNAYSIPVGTSNRTDYFNFTGNFVWVRTKVNVTSGFVAAINYNH